VRNFAFTVSTQKRMNEQPATISPPPFTVCIPAAGSGRRMGLETPKQYQPLLGKPVLRQTIAVFEQIPLCSKIVIATDDRDALEHIFHQWPCVIPVEIVDGGVTRQSSVANTLTHCREDDAIVLIHDAARPCVAIAQVLTLVEAVYQHGAALLAMPSMDTVKKVHDSLVKETMNRNEIWLAQTPQGAKAGLFREAFARAQQDGVTGTDDVSLLERIGITVHVVEGDATNIKITTQADLVIAEALLMGRGRRDV